MSEQEIAMNIDDLTIGEAKRLAAMFSEINGLAAPVALGHPARSVLVWTDKRGVIFGETTDASARPITLKNARMCLYWSADVGGVFGLASVGPTAGCKISDTLPSAVFEGVTGVAEVSPAAEIAWRSAPVQGRSK